MKIKNSLVLLSLLLTMGLNSCGGTDSKMSETDFKNTLTALTAKDCEHLKVTYAQVGDGSSTGGFGSSGTYLFDKDANAIKFEGVVSSSGAVETAWYVCFDEDNPYLLSESGVRSDSLSINYMKTFDEYALLFSGFSIIGAIINAIPYSSVTYEKDDNGNDVYAYSLSASVGGMSTENSYKFTFKNDGLVGFYYETKNSGIEGLGDLVMIQDYKYEFNTSERITLPSNTDNDDVTTTTNSNKENVQMSAEEWNTYFSTFDSKFDHYRIDGTVKEGEGENSLTVVVVGDRSANAFYQNYDNNDIGYFCFSEGGCIILTSNDGGTKYDKTSSNQYDSYDSALPSMTAFSTIKQLDYSTVTYNKEENSYYFEDSDSGMTYTIIFAGSEVSRVRIYYSSNEAVEEITYTFNCEDRLTIPQN